MKIWRNNKCNSLVNTHGLTYFAQFEFPKNCFDYT